MKASFGHGSAHHPVAHPPSQTSSLSTSTPPSATLQPQFRHPQQSSPTTRQPQPGTSKGQNSIQSQVRKVQSNSVNNPKSTRVNSSSETLDQHSAGEQYAVSPPPPPPTSRPLTGTFDLPLIQKRIERNLKRYRLPHDWYQVGTSWSDLESSTDEDDLLDETARQEFRAKKEAQAAASSSSQSQSQSLPNLRTLRSGRRSSSGPPASEETLASQNQNQPGTSQQSQRLQRRRASSDEDVARLPLADIDLIGQHPGRENLLAIICRVCKRVVKAGAFANHMETRHFHLIAPIKYPNGDAPPRALRYSQFIAGRIRNTKKETTASPDKTAAASVPAATATMEPPTPEAPKTPPKNLIPEFKPIPGVSAEAIAAAAAKAAMKLPTPEEDRVAARKAAELAAMPDNPILLLSIEEEQELLIRRSQAAFNEEPMVEYEVADEYENLVGSGHEFPFEEDLDVLPLLGTSNDPVKEAANRAKIEARIHEKIEARIAERLRRVTIDESLGQYLDPNRVAVKMPPKKVKTVTETKTETVESKKEEEKKEKEPEATAGQPKTSLDPKSSANIQDDLDLGDIPSPPEAWKRAAELGVPMVRVAGRGIVSLEEYLDGTPYSVNQVLRAAESASSSNSSSSNSIATGEQGQSLSTLSSLSSANFGSGGGNKSLDKRGSKGANNSRATISKRKPRGAAAVAAAEKAAAVAAAAQISSANANTNNATKTAVNPSGRVLRNSTKAQATIQPTAEATLAPALAVSSVTFSLATTATPTLTTLTSSLLSTSLSATTIKTRLSTSQPSTSNLHLQKSSAVSGSGNVSLPLPLFEQAAMATRRRNAQASINAQQKSSSSSINISLPTELQKILREAEEEGKAVSVVPKPSQNPVFQSRGKPAFQQQQSRARDNSPATNMESVSSNTTSSQKLLSLSPSSFVVVPKSTSASSTAVIEKGSSSNVSSSSILATSFSSSSSSLLSSGSSSAPSVISMSTSSGSSTTTGPKVYTAIRRTSIPNATINAANVATVTSAGAGGGGAGRSILEQKARASSFSGRSSTSSSSSSLLLNTGGQNISSSSPNLKSSSTESNVTQQSTTTTTTFTILKGNYSGDTGANKVKNVPLSPKAKAKQAKSSRATTLIQGVQGGPRTTNTGLNISGDTPKPADDNSTSASGAESSSSLTQSLLTNDTNQQPRQQQKFQQSNVSAKLSSSSGSEPVVGSSPMMTMTVRPGATPTTTVATSKSVKTKASQRNQMKQQQKQIQQQQNLQQSSVSDSTGSATQNVPNVSNATSQLNSITQSTSSTSSTATATATPQSSSTIPPGTTASKMIAIIPAQNASGQMVSQMMILSGLPQTASEQQQNAKIVEAAAKRMQRQQQQQQQMQQLSSPSTSTVPPPPPLQPQQSTTLPQFSPFNSSSSPLPPFQTSSVNVPMSGPALDTNFNGQTSLLNSSTALNQPGFGTPSPSNVLSSLMNSNNSSLFAGGSSSSFQSNQPMFNHQNMHNNQHQPIFFGPHEPDSAEQQLVEQLNQLAELNSGVVTDQDGYRLSRHPSISAQESADLIADLDELIKSEDPSLLDEALSSTIPSSSADIINQSSDAVILQEQGQQEVIVHSPLPPMLEEFANDFINADLRVLEESAVGGAITAGGADDGVGGHDPVNAGEQSLLASLSSLDFPDTPPLFSPADDGDGDDKPDLPDLSPSALFSLDSNSDPPGSSSFTGLDDDDDDGDGMSEASSRHSQATTHESVLIKSESDATGGSTTTAVVELKRSQRKRKRSRVFENSSLDGKNPRNIKCKDRTYNADEHCGVLLPGMERPCTRSLTCRTHLIAFRRAVEGRSRPFDELILEYRKERGMKDIRERKRIRVKPPPKTPTSDSGSVPPFSNVQLQQPQKQQQQQPEQLQSQQVQLLQPSNQESILQKSTAQPVLNNNQTSDSDAVVLAMLSAATKEQQDQLQQQQQQKMIMMTGIGSLMTVQHLSPTPSQNASQMLTNISGTFSRTAATPISTPVTQTTPVTLIKTPSTTTTPSASRSHKSKSAQNHPVVFSTPEQIDAIIDSVLELPALTEEELVQRFPTTATTSYSANSTQQILAEVSPASSDLIVLAGRAADQLSSSSSNSNSTSFSDIDPLVAMEAEDHLGVGPGSLSASTAASTSSFASTISLDSGKSVCSNEQLSVSPEEADLADSAATAAVELSIPAQFVATSATSSINSTTISSSSSNHLDDIIYQVSKGELAGEVLEEEKEKEEEEKMEVKELTHQQPQIGVHQLGNDSNTRLFMGGDHQMYPQEAEANAEIERLVREEQMLQKQQQQQSSAPSPALGSWSKFSAAAATPTMIMTRKDGTLEDLFYSSPSTSSSDPYTAQQKQQYPGEEPEWKKFANSLNNNSSEQLEAQLFFSQTEGIEMEEDSFEAFCRDAEAETQRGLTMANIEDEIDIIEIGDHEDQQEKKEVQKRGNHSAKSVKSRILANARAKLAASLARPRALIATFGPQQKKKQTETTLLLQKQQMAKTAKETLTLGAGNSKQSSAQSDPNNPNAENVSPSKKKKKRKLMSKKIKKAKNDKTESGGGCCSSAEKTQQIIDLINETYADDEYSRMLALDHLNAGNLDSVFEEFFPTKFADKSSCHKKRKGDEGEDADVESAESSSSSVSSPKSVEIIDSSPSSSEVEEVVKNVGNGSGGDHDLENDQQEYEDEDEDEDDDDKKMVKFRMALKDDERSYETLNSPPKPLRPLYTVEPPTIAITYRGKSGKDNRAFKKQRIAKLLKQRQEQQKKLKQQQQKSAQIENPEQETGSQEENPQLLENEQDGSVQLLETIMITDDSGKSSSNDNDNESTEGNPLDLAMEHHPLTACLINYKFKKEKEEIAGDDDDDICLIPQERRRKGSFVPTKFKVFDVEKSTEKLVTTMAISTEVEKQPNGFDLFSCLGGKSRQVISKAKKTESKIDTSSLKMTPLHTINLDSESESDFSSSNSGEEIEQPLPVYKGSGSAKDSCSPIDQQSETTAPTNTSSNNGTATSDQSSLNQQKNRNTTSASQRATSPSLLKLQQLKSGQNPSVQRAFIQHQHQQEGVLENLSSWTSSGSRVEQVTSSKSILLNGNTTFGSLSLKVSPMPKTTAQSGSSSPASSALNSPSNSNLNLLSNINGTEINGTNNLTIQNGRAVAMNISSSPNPSSVPANSFSSPVQSGISCSATSDLISPLRSSLSRPPAAVQMQLNSSKSPFGGAISAVSYNLGAAGGSNGLANSSTSGGGGTLPSLRNSPEPTTLKNLLNSGTLLNRSLSLPVIRPPQPLPSAMMTASKINSSTNPPVAVKSMPTGSVNSSSSVLTLNRSFSTPPQQQQQLSLASKSSSMMTVPPPVLSSMTSSSDSLYPYLQQKNSGKNNNQSSKQAKQTSESEQGISLRRSHRITFSIGRRHKTPNQDEDQRKKELLIAKKETQIIESIKTDLIESYEEKRRRSSLQPSTSDGLLSQKLLMQQQKPQTLQRPKSASLSGAATTSKVPFSKTQTSKTTSSMAPHFTSSFTLSSNTVVSLPRGASDRLTSSAAEQLLAETVPDDILSIIEEIEVSQNQGQNQNQNQSQNQNQQNQRGQIQQQQQLNVASQSSTTSMAINVQNMEQLIQNASQFASLPQLNLQPQHFQFSNNGTVATQLQNQQQPQQEQLQQLTHQRQSQKVVLGQLKSQQQPQQQHFIQLGPNVMVSTTPNTLQQQQITLSNNRNLKNSRQQLQSSNIVSAVPVSTNTSGNSSGIIQIDVQQLKRKLEAETQQNQQQQGSVTSSVVVTPVVAAIGSGNAGTGGGGSVIPTTPTNTAAIILPNTGNNNNQGTPLRGFRNVICMQKSPFQLSTSPVQTQQQQIQSQQLNLLQTSPLQSQLITPKSAGLKICFGSGGVNDQPKVVLTPKLIQGQPQQLTQQQQQQPAQSSTTLQQQLQRQFQQQQQVQPQQQQQQQQVSKPKPQLILPKQPGQQTPPHTTIVATKSSGSKSATLAQKSQVTYIRSTPVQPVRQQPNVLRAIEPKPGPSTSTATSSTSQSTQTSVTTVATTSLTTSLKTVGGSGTSLVTPVKPVTKAPNVFSVQKSQSLAAGKSSTDSLSTTSTISSSSTSTPTKLTKSPIFNSRCDNLHNLKSLNSAIAVSGPPNLKLQRSQRTYLKSPLKDSSAAPVASATATTAAIASTATTAIAITTAATSAAGTSGTSANLVASFSATKTQPQQLQLKQQQQQTLIIPVTKKGTTQQQQQQQIEQILKIAQKSSVVGSASKASTSFVAAKSVSISSASSSTTPASVSGTAAGTSIISKKLTITSTPQLITSLGTTDTQRKALFAFHPSAVGTSSGAGGVSTAIAIATSAPHGANTTATTTATLIPISLNASSNAFIVPLSSLQSMAAGGNGNGNLGAGGNGQGIFILAPPSLAQQQQSGGSGISVSGTQGITTVSAATAQQILQAAAAAAAQQGQSIQLSSSAGSGSGQSSSGGSNSGGITASNSTITITSNNSSIIQHGNIIQPTGNAVASSAGESGNSAFSSPIITPITAAITTTTVSGGENNPLANRGGGSENTTVQLRPVVHLQQQQQQQFRIQFQSFNPNKRFKSD